MTEFTATAADVTAVLRDMLGPIPVDAEEYRPNMLRFRGELVSREGLETAWLVYKDAVGSDRKWRLARAARLMYAEHGYDFGQAAALVELAAGWTGNVTTAARGARP